MAMMHCSSLTKAVRKAQPFPVSRTLNGVSCHTMMRRHISSLKPNNQNHRSPFQQQMHHRHSLTTPLPKDLVPKRGIIEMLSTMHPITFKILMGTAVAGSYVAYLSYIRAAFKQRYYIAKKLRTPSELVIPPLALDRKNERKILKKYFNSPPSGPSVIIGPESAGKGALLKTIFKDRKMTIWLDLKQNPVTNGEEFLVSFINTTGYLLPVTSSMWTSLIGIGGGARTSASGYSNQELDSALTALSDILRAEKENGWPDGVPIICLDDIHRLGTCNDLDLGNTNVSDDPNFLKFMDWCVHVSDSKLAHIVFVTSYAFAHLDLDTHAGFRRRRSLICIDYAEPDTVKTYLSNLGTQYEHFQRKPLSPEAIDNIVSCVGGHVEDLDRVITGLLRGDAYYNILRSMLTDSISEIEDHLEGILEQASKTNDIDVKHQVFEKYLRFWNLMEILSKDRHVNKRSIVVSVFHHQHTEELERLLATNLISFVNERFPDSIGKKVDSIFTLLNSSLDSIALTAGSPKVRMAFELLLKDEKMLKQKIWVQGQYDMKILREKEKEAIKAREQYSTEHSQKNGQLEKIVSSEDKWIAVLGKDEVIRRKQRVLALERDLEKLIEEETTKLTTIRADIAARS